MDIEEAWGRVEQTYVAAGFAAMGGDVTTIRAAFAAHTDAARALALAVLEEAACDCDGSHESNCPWLEQVPRVRAVSEAIERLGG